MIYFLAREPCVKRLIIMRKTTVCRIPFISLASLTFVNHVELLPWFQVICFLIQGGMMATIIPCMEHHLYPQHTKDPSRKTQRQTTETSFFSQAFRFEYLLSSLEQRFQKLGLYIIKTLLLWKLSKGRPGAVVRAVSLSHQIVGSKQPLRRFAGGRLASIFPFPRPHSCGSLRHWVCLLFYCFLNLTYVVSFWISGQISLAQNL